MSSLALVAIASTASAQRQGTGWGGGTSTGTLSPAVSYSLIEAHRGAGLNEQHAIKAIVLWRNSDIGRVPPARSASDTLHGARQPFRALERAAEDSGRWFVGQQHGTSVSNAEYDPTRGRLFLLGRAFDIPSGDTAIVILVDHSDGIGGAPTIAATAYMPATMPDAFWPKSWTSGDTTYFVHTHHGESEQMLMASLRRVPALRGLLE